MHVVIVGNGIAGVTAALRVRAEQPEWRVSIISGESRYHYSRPALMYVYMGQMRYQDAKPFEDSMWQERRIDLIRDWAVAVDTDRRLVRLHRGSPVAYDRLLIATGSKSNRFGWKGQDLAGVQGLYDLMDMELLGRNTNRCRNAVIVGGGLIGIELAEMLHAQGIPVTFLVREESYWDNVLPKEESGMINRLIREHGFDLKLSTQLQEIVDDGHGRVGAVVTDTGERILCQLVGLTAGVSPNIDLARGTSIGTGRGILVDASFRTSAEHVFAAGDCAEIQPGGDARNLIQQVWYTGRAQGEVAGRVIAGETCTYDPGIWFNSAKFLDLEYQVYGRVNMRLPGEKNLYWEHPGNRHAVRIVYVNGVVVGMNFMGIRYRHEVCERWIREQRSVAHVLTDLSAGNFDPEFFDRHEDEIVGALADQYENERREAVR